MRRIFYGLSVSIAIIYVFSFSGCSEDKQNSPQPDPAKGGAEQKVTATSETTKYKRLVFFDTKTIKELTEDKSLSYLLEKGFIPYNKEDFEKFASYFTSIFKVGSVNSTISDFSPRAFSIYYKYHDFQHFLGIKQPFADAPTNNIENWVRVYPALDGNKVFYLVFMSEKIDKTKLMPDTVSDRRVYYVINEDGLGMIPLNEMNSTEADIARFQEAWRNLSDPNHPNYRFVKVNSFSYSIGDYDELLGNSQNYFWDLNKYKNDSRSRKETRIVPVIDTLNTDSIRLRLVLLPYKPNFLGTKLIIDDDRAYFDNMYPCPTICPLNPIN
jgi:hypothetical protein